MSQTGLSERERRFVEAYLETANATEAAEVAGYSHPKQLGSRLLGRPRVKEALDARRQELLPVIGITTEKTLREVARVGYGNISQVLDWGPAIVVRDAETDAETVAQGVAIKPSAELDDDALALISEIRQTKDGLAVKMHDKLAALEKMARIQGLYAPTKVEHSGTVDHTLTMSKMDLARRVLKALREGAAEAKAKKEAA